MEQVSPKVMNARFSTQMRNGVACKDKWGTIARNFEKNYDYKHERKKNQDYWSLNITKKVAWRLPRTFGRRLYKMVVEFLGTCPIFNPPHMWDLMDDANKNYKPSILTHSDTINLNENSIDVNYEAMQNVNAKKNTNADDG